ncbi:ATP-dependent DNA helicase Hrp3 [Blastocladiella emersonii ATCC 22665]|nr:ATP-dependent DNA helicase Hrp3 [Blastocladiella emersonii ATCC 22665]
MSGSFISPDDDPELFGLRRSGRARRTVAQYADLMQQDSDGDDDLPDAHRPSRTRKRRVIDSDDDEFRQPSPPPRAAANRTKRPRRRAAAGSDDEDDDASFGGDSDQHDDDDDEADSESDDAETSDSDAEYGRSSSSRRRRPQRAAQGARRRNGASQSRRKTSARNTNSYSDDSDLQATAVRFSTRRRTAVSYTEPNYADPDSSSDPDDLDSHLDDGASGYAAAPVDEGPTIEQVLDHRVIHAKGDDGLIDETVPPVTEYLVKWKNKSHLHNTWHAEPALKGLKGIKKLNNYVKLLALDTHRDDLEDDELEQRNIDLELRRNLLEEYKQVERVLGARTAPADPETGHMGEAEYLCKWRRLEYSECTWERASAITPQFQAEIDTYFARENSAFLPNRGKHYTANDTRPRWTSREQPAYVAAGTLRDYQLLGVAWMLYLWSRNENGILADEMGLGKTVQTITTLNIMMQEHRVHGPFLVVVPLSVIHSWQAEFAKWAPEMNVVVYIGNRDSRERIRDYELYLNSANGESPEHKRSNRYLKINVLLTTFELVLKDQAELRAIKWSYLAVDEAHRLKNSGSQLYEALKDFNTVNRLLITGTPLQNTIGELNALIQFLMPGKFADLEDFDLRLGEEGSEEKIKHLHERLRPFMLRRLKRDVEKSLPNKTERILRVDLAPMQIEYYKSILTRNFSVLNKGVAAGAQISLLNVVGELKKASNHPFLFPGAEAQYLTDLPSALSADGTPAAPPTGMSPAETLRALLVNSGKMLLLDKLLTRLKSGGHRVLIFSQMVRMLDILTDYLALREYKFQRLDGSVSAEQRKKAVDQFNAPDSPDFVFLLSTRAGGLGLNLTTADTVIIFDSDWNAANDSQAMARAHRIGQTKTVHVYRLVSKNTIEEEIIERAKRKMILEYCIIKQMDTSGRHVLQAVAGSKGLAMLPGMAGGGAMKLPTEKVSRDELSAILKFGAQDLFAKDSAANAGSMDDVDLDGILASAEENEAKDKQAFDEIDAAAAAAAAAQANDVALPPAEDAESSSEFLRQFQVTEFGLDQLKWEDIIPEEDRKAAEEAERKRQEEEQRKLEESMLMRKYKKSIAPGTAGAAASEDGAAAPPPAKRRRKEPATAANRAAAAAASTTANGTDLNERDLRALSRSICRFGDITMRQTEILADAQITGRTWADVQATAQAMVTACEDAVTEATAAGPVRRMITCDFHGVPINASQVVSRVRDLSLLGEVMRGYLGQRDVGELLSFRVTLHLKPVTNWSVTWSSREDSLLVVGVYLHGFGNWMKIREDTRLGLADKMFLLDEEKEKIPRQEHLTRRAEYVIRVLNDKHLSSRPPAPAAPRASAAALAAAAAASSSSSSSAARNGTKSRRGAAAASSSSTRATNGTGDSDLSDLDSPHEEDKKRPRARAPAKRAKAATAASPKKTKKAAAPKKARALPEKPVAPASTTTRSGRRTNNSLASTSAPATSATAAADHDSSAAPAASSSSAPVPSKRSSSSVQYGDSDSDIDYDLDACKACMKPAKAALRQLRSTPEIKETAEKVAVTTSCLHTIGALVMRQPEALHTDLWKYVAEWFPNRPRWRTVRDLYTKLAQSSSSSSSTPARPASPHPGPPPPLPPAGDDAERPKSGLSASVTAADAGAASTTTLGRQHFSSRNGSAAQSPNASASSIDRGSGSAQQQQHYRDRDRDRDGRSDRDRDRHGSGYGGSSSSRDYHRSDRSDRYDRDRDYHRDRDYPSSRDRDRDRDHYRGRNSGGGGDRDRDRERDRDRDRDYHHRDRHRERERERDRDRAASSVSSPALRPRRWPAASKLDQSTQIFDLPEPAPRPPTVDPPAPRTQAKLAAALDQLQSLHQHAAAIRRELLNAHDLDAGTDTFTASADTTTTYTSSATTATTLPPPVALSAALQAQLLNENAELRARVRALEAVFGTNVSDMSRSPAVVRAAHAFAQETARAVEGAGADQPWDTAELRHARHELACMPAPPSIGAVQAAHQSLVSALVRAVTASDEAVCGERDRVAALEAQLAESQSRAAELKQRLTRARSRTARLVQLLRDRDAAYQRVHQESSDSARALDAVRAELRSALGGRDAAAQKYQRLESGLRVALSWVAQHLAAIRDGTVEFTATARLAAWPRDVVESVQDVVDAVCALPRAVAQTEQSSTADEHDAKFAAAAATAANVIAELERRVMEAHSDASRLGQESGELRARLADVEKERVAAEKRWSVREHKLLSQIEALGAEVARADHAAAARITQARREYSSLRDLYSRAKEDLERERKVLAESAETIRNLKHRNTILVKKCAAKDVRMTSLELVAAAINDDCKGESDETARKATDLARDHGRRGNQIRSLQATVADLRAALAHAEAMIKAESERVQRAERRVGEREARIRSHEALLRWLVAQLTEAHDAAGQDAPVAEIPSVSAAEERIAQQFLGLGVADLYALSTRPRREPRSDSAAVQARLDIILDPRAPPGKLVASLKELFSQLLSE